MFTSKPVQTVQDVMNAATNDLDVIKAREDKIAEEALADIEALEYTARIALEESRRADKAINNFKELFGFNDSNEIE